MMNTLKRISLGLILILIAGTTFGQRFAYVDTEYILENIPEYNEAQKKLDQLSVEWQKQIEKKYAEIEKMYQEYQAEQVLLTDEMKKKRQEQIIEKEQEAKEFQKKKFGVEGELFQKRQELIKPLQDKVYNAVKDVAKLSGYSVIFDKAGEGVTMLYTDPKYNKSDKILDKLGYEPGETKD